MLRLKFVLLVWASFGLFNFALSNGFSSNWLIRAVAKDLYESALLSLSLSNIDSALSSLIDSFGVYPTFNACEKLGWIYENIGLQDESTTWFRKCIELDTSQVGVHIHNANVAYRMRDYSTALMYVNYALNVQQDSVEALFQKGVILQNSGDVQGAADIFHQGTEVNPLEVKCALNLAALHHKYGSVNDALFFYQMALARVDVFMNESAKMGRRHLNRHYLMVKSNLAAAYLQLGALSRSYKEITDLINLLMLEHNEHCNSSNQPLSILEDRPISCSEISRTISSSLGVQMIVQRSSALWLRWEETVQRVLRDTLHNIAAGLDFEGPLLPFDTLLTVMSLEDRLFIARSASALISRARSVLPARSTYTERKKLKIGFMSFDFNNHPTAHLVEGIFSIIRKHRTTVVAAGDRQVMTSLIHNRFDDVELFIYSYGRDDNSTYRQQLVALSDHFIELSHLAHGEAAETIHSHQLDILLDMQLHTLGHRLEITAHRPAPIQINYLVYPGTSGAAFFNYIIADAVVTPAEHAPHYSESLLLLPPTYQVSFFDRLTHLVDPSTVSMSIQERRTHLRRLHGLPSGSADVIFCNFNKIDKIDPQSFALWMSILRKVPRSYLWLLEPAETSAPSIVDKTTDTVEDLLERDSRASSLQNNLVRQHLVANAMALGVKESQLLFAPRTDKASHIFRHAAADLFLDTLVYGAHSTATDALRGGLPVLTVLGDTFPSRVAPSLYASLPPSSSCDRLQQTLVVHSQKEFEEVAIRLTRRSQSRLWQLKESLHDVVEHTRGLFDTVEAVDKFVRGMMAVQETRYALHTQKTKNGDKDYHIVVTKISQYS